MYTKSYSMLTALKKIDSHQLSILKHHLNSLILVTKAIGSISRLDELLERILHYTLTVTGAERGFLFLYNQKKEGLILEVMHGVNEKPPGEVFSFETYRVSQEIIKVVENTGKALIISQEDSNVTQGFRELNLYGIKQVLCVPFEVRDKRIGFLYLDHSIDGVMFREEELKLIESFATLTSLSIDNAYLKRKIEKRELNNISVTITTIPTMPDLTIIILKGILDDITMKETDKKIMPFIEHEASDIIIDISNIDYASKSGIFYLVKYMVLITNKNKKLKFVKPPQHIYKNMEIIGFSKRFDLYDTIGEALSTFS